MRGKRLDTQERDDNLRHLYARRQDIQFAPLVHQEHAPRLLYRLRLPNSILQLIAKFPQSIAGRDFLLGRTLRIDKARQMVAEPASQRPSGEKSSLAMQTELDAGEGEHLARGPVPPPVPPLEVTVEITDATQECLNNESQLAESDRFGCSARRLSRSGRNSRASSIIRFSRRATRS